MRRIAVMVIALMLLTVSLPSAAAAAPPANDNVANATVLSGTSGSVSGDNTEATLEQYEAGLAGLYSVWYRWSPGRKDLVATFSTCDGATFDTVLKVYTSNATPPTMASLSWVAENDDACDEGPQSRVTFLAKAGVTYLIRLTGWASGEYGPFTLTWSTAASVKGTLSVTITNMTKDTNSCVVTVKGSALAPDQRVWVKSSQQYGPLWFTEAGRWNPDPQAVERSFWNMNASGEVYLNDAIYSSDGVTPVIPNITNRCK